MTLFKARALHYASEYAEIEKNSWVLHLDEESYFDIDNGNKIIDHIINENYLIKYKDQKPSYANGVIV